MGAVYLSDGASLLYGAGGDVSAVDNESPHGADGGQVQSGEAAALWTEDSDVGGSSGSGGGPVPSVLQSDVELK